MAEILFKQVAHRYKSTSKANSAAEQELALSVGDFCWQDGGAYALLGPSGCGKSTLLNITSGLLAPSQGEVFFDGVNVTNQSTADRNIAQVFQFPVIYDTMTVRNNLAFPLRNRGMKEPEVSRRVGEIAEMLELDAVLNKKARGLSADQKQLISLGRGLVRKDVSAILFDEPLTVIDPHQKFKLRRKLKEIHRHLKLTLIYVTHDQSEALTFADQVLVMNKGKILQQGTPEQLFENPAHSFVGHFIGSPGMNFLSCDLGNDAVRIAGMVIPMDTQLCQQGLKQLATLDKNVTTSIGIRPEYLQLSGDPQLNGKAGIAVTLESLENYDAYQMATVSFSGATVRVKTRQPPESGTLYLQVPESKIRLYVNDILVNANG
jgi:glycerol transport system ATP-binding protein